MADKYATVQEAIEIGQNTVTVNGNLRYKLVPKEDLRAYNCRLVDGAKSYADNQCVLLKDLEANMSGDTRIQINNTYIGCLDIQNGTAFYISYKRGPYEAYRGSMASHYSPQDVLYYLLPMNANQVSFSQQVYGSKLWGDEVEYGMGFSGNTTIVTDYLPWTEGIVHCIVSMVITFADGTSKQINKSYTPISTRILDTNSQGYSVYECTFNPDLGYGTFCLAGWFINVGNTKAISDINLSIEWFGTA